MAETPPRPHPRGPWPWGQPILGLFLHHQPWEGSERVKHISLGQNPLGAMMLESHSTQSRGARPFGPGDNLPWFEVWTPASASWLTPGWRLNLSVPQFPPLDHGAEKSPTFCVVRINEMMPVRCSAQA